MLAPVSKVNRTLPRLWGYGDLTPGKLMHKIKLSGI